MSSQRISRGFHRLGLILAALPLLAGVALSAFWALDDANRGQREHVKLVCANEKLATLPKDALRPPKERVTGAKPWEQNWELSLKSAGCSDHAWETVSVFDAKNPPPFNWLATFLETFLVGVAISAVVAAAAYGVVRAIGWVIGGFAAT